jgi:ABC-type antimicrobial peptide transport system permease subunit
MTGVGVVADTRHQSLDDHGLAQIYFPRSQHPGTYMRLLVRSGGEPAQLANAVRQAVRTVDPRLPITEVRTMAEVVEEFLVPQWAMAITLGVVGAGAMALACLGIYGVMAFFVGQRRREIAVRMALGARRGDVELLVLWRGMKLALAGVVPGLVLAVMMARLMRSLLFGTSAADAATFVAVPLVLTLVAAAACLIPARRAAKVDPMNVLRYE